MPEQPADVPRFAWAKGMGLGRFRGRTLEIRADPGVSPTRLSQAKDETMRRAEKQDGPGRYGAAPRPSKVKRRAAGLTYCAVVAVSLLFGGSAASARPGASSSCSEATRVKKQAQAAFSSAVRKANAAAARYRTCMTRQRNKRSRCSAEHAAFRRAGRHRDDMRAAYTFARDKAARACRK